MKGNKAYIGLLGLGTVGSGVAHLLQEGARDLELRTGFRLEIKRILVRDINRPRQVQVPRELLTTNPEDILLDDEIDVIVEVIGGVEPAKSLMTAALVRGTPVVTANKEVMADHWDEVFAAAQAGGTEIFFEGSVGGGIPVLRPLKESLSGDTLRRVTGIVNGTTNFILTRMSEQGLSYEAALAEAQRLGYAEADPTADVEGIDAARKLAILASICFRSPVRSSDIQTEGISQVTAADIAYGRSRGWRLKLLAEAEERDGEIVASVRPTFVGPEHPLANVNDVMNAILVEGEGVGETMFYGRGAGSLPTGSAVLGDILQAVRHLDKQVAFRPPVRFRELRPAPRYQRHGRFYLRLEMAHSSTVAADLVRSLEIFGLGLERLDQRDRRDGTCEVHLVIQPGPEAAVRHARAHLNAQPWVHEAGLPLLLLATEPTDQAEPLLPALTMGQPVVGGASR